MDFLGFLRKKNFYKKLFKKLILNLFGLLLNFTLFQNSFYEYIKFEI